MGTRAAFWIGDPRKVKETEWLGCVAWDGYVWMEDKEFASIKTEEEFRTAIDTIKSERNDFADPANGGFPFPWPEDIFLTDCTYAYFDGCVYATWSHNSFKKLLDVICDKSKKWEGNDDPTMINIPIAEKYCYYDRNQPDSIMILSI